MFQEAQDGGSDGEQDAVEEDNQQLDVSVPSIIWHESHIDHQSTPMLCVVKISCRYRHFQAHDSGKHSKLFSTDLGHVSWKCM